MAEVFRQSTLEEKCTNPLCNKKLRQFEDQLQRVKSVGYDMLKQRGTWQTSGQTPAEISLDFNNIFDHEADDAAKSLMKNAGVEEDEARRLVCNVFQRMNDNIRNQIFEKVVDTLYKVFTIGSEEDSDEQLFDISRAYGLLLNASGVLQNPQHESVAEQACGELQSTYKDLPVAETQSFTAKSAKVSWNMLTMVPPLLSTTPPSHYYREWHEKEMPPTWNSKLSEYELVYYRPTLFISCEGKVARKGWVGNKEAVPHKPEQAPSSGNSREIYNKSQSDKGAKKVSGIEFKTTSLCPSKPRTVKPLIPNRSAYLTSKASDPDKVEPSFKECQQRPPKEQEPPLQEKPVTSMYYPQASYYTKEEDVSPIIKTQSSTNQNRIWTGETQWKMRP